MAPSSHAPAAAAAELGPLALRERVPLYDVLRGFCLFGVLWSNLNDWYLFVEPVTSTDHAIQWTQEWLVESRLYSMLGFLFGIGFAIQLTRAAQRGQDVRNLFMRRMAALLGFGIVHALLIWHGDILVAYALAGFALVLFRRLSPRQLLMTAAALYLLLPYAVLHAAAAFNVPLPRYDATWRQLITQAHQAEAHGSWVQSVIQGDRQFLGGLVRSLLQGGTARFLALFVLGLWAVRVDLVARLTRRRTNILWALVGALACWAGLQYAQLHLAQWWPPLSTQPAPNWRQLHFWWPPRGTVVTSLDDLVTWANSAAYALTLALAASFPWAARRLQPLGVLGRMTLTTYLVQSIVCTLCFCNWGFGLMNNISLTGILVFTVVLFTLQIVFSVWWLNRYRFGPAEWLWRSLTYRRKLPLVVAPASPVETTAATA